MKGNFEDYEAQLRMQKPIGMRAKTAMKAELYLAHLYMHGLLTTDQIRALTGSVDSIKEVERVLRASGYVKAEKHAVTLYRDGAWRRLNHVNVWRLKRDAELIVERDIYDGSHKWGYSSGKIERVLTSRCERILRVAELMAALGRAKEYDISFWNVAQMLNQLGAREAYESGESTDAARLWRDRPPMVGMVGVDDTRLVGLSLYDSEGLQGLTQYMNRAFPVAFENLAGNGLAVMTVLLLVNDLYQKCFSSLHKIRTSRPNLLVLPYEYCIDHPSTFAEILRGNRRKVFQSLIDRYANDGWIVEETSRVSELAATESYTWRARKNGKVEYFDSTLGAGLGRLYSVITNERVKAYDEHVGNRVVYVTSKREAEGISRFIKKAYKGQIKDDVEYRVMDW